MSPAGGIRSTSGTCVSNTGMTPVVRARPRLEPCWPAPTTLEAFDEVPYFWSDQYDLKLQMLGVTTDYDAFEIIEGDPDAWDFVAAYGRRGRTVAVPGHDPGPGLCLSGRHREARRIPPEPTGLAQGRTSAIPRRARGDSRRGFLGTASTCIALTRSSKFIANACRIRRSRCSVATSTRSPSTAPATPRRPPPTSPWIASGSSSTPASGCGRRKPTVNAATRCGTSR